jgi:Uma2 family endonuclease
MSALTAVTAAAPPCVYTADDLLRMGSDARFELVLGELKPMPPPAGPEHGSVTFDLGLEVGWFVRQNRLERCFAAETGFMVAQDPDTVLAPDLAFVAAERLPSPLPVRGFLPVVPDLVLETRSPGDTPSEVAEKVANWLAAGVRMVWDMNLRDHMLTIYRPGEADPRVLGAADVLDGGDVLPGFSLPLARVFAAE